MSGTFHTLEWLRLGADAVFLIGGVLPIVLATLRGTLGASVRPDAVPGLGLKPLAAPRPR